MNNEKETKKALASGAADKGNVEEALRKLIDVLEEDNILYEEDADDIRAILDSTNVASAPKSKYSDSDISEMFNFLG